MSGIVKISDLTPDDLIKLYINYLDKLASKSIDKDTITGLSISKEANLLDIIVYGVRTWGILIIGDNSSEIITDKIYKKTLYGIISKEYDTLAACRIFAKGEYGIIYVFFTSKELAEKYAEGVEDFTVMECIVTRKI